MAPRRYQVGPRRGEQRRTALLDALKRLLESRPLSQITVGDIAEAAGLTRPAFYFYFPSKAAAAAALIEDIYEALLEASGRWHGVDTGRASDELRDGFEAVVAYARTNPKLMVATFDAVGSDAEVRDVWQHWMRELANRVADKIVRERLAGRALQGADPLAIGIALVAMNERVLELEVRRVVAGGEPLETLPGALYEIWERAIYGAMA
jgi:TetR/AcrR family transcriptional regulator, ethionamide resistance regulator